MITRGYKQMSKTRRRLSFLSLIYLYIPSLFLTCSSEGSLGDSPFPVELLCRSSGELGHLDTGLRSVDQSNSFHLVQTESSIQVGIQIAKPCPTSCTCCVQSGSPENNDVIKENCNIPGKIVNETKADSR